MELNVQGDDYFPSGIITMESDHNNEDNIPLNQENYPIVVVDIDH